MMLIYLTVCELCGKPTHNGDLHPQAVVVHLECLKKQTQQVRQFVQSLNTRKKAEEKCD
jgi:hypothetical protein